MRPLFHSRESQEPRLSVTPLATSAYSSPALHAIKRDMLLDQPQRANVSERPRPGSLMGLSGKVKNGIRRLAVLLSQPSDATAKCHASIMACQILRLPYFGEHV